MNTPRVRSAPPLTHHLVRAGLFGTNPFQLVDVGARGGIESKWAVFGESLKAIGFEPLVGEVERLNAQPSNPQVHYRACLVGYRRYEELFPNALRDKKIETRNNLAFRRTSAFRAVSEQQLHYVRTDPDCAAELIELDDLVDGATGDVDYVKIDTDGSDYPVLLGAKRLMRSGPVLALSVECQFHGPVHDEANLFSNIDRLLRSEGFSLFDLEVYRYSRGALPKRFVYRIPAQTVEGQVLWADSLYLRDLGDRDYEEKWAISVTDAKILKLACIMEIFGLEDCAAELLLKYRERLSAIINISACLDMITPELNGKRVSFEEYSRAFAQDAKRFYPPSR